jgi:hypothetical protein
MATAESTTTPPTTPPTIPATGAEWDEDVVAVEVLEVSVT